MASISNMLTVAEAAAELKVTDARVRQIILEGKLHAKRIGGRLLLIERKDFEKFRKHRE